MSFRVNLSDLWRNKAANCLQKELEMDGLLVRVLGPKEIGLFRGGWVVLPERDLRSFQYLEGLSQWSELERVSCHFWRACWEKDEDICSLSWVIFGGWRGQLCGGSHIQI